MEKIEYTYKVIEVSDKSMLVEFSADGLQTYKVGCQLPLVGEKIDDIIAAYAPIQAWKLEVSEYQSVEVGQSSSIVYSTGDEDPTIGMSADELFAYNKKAKLDQLASNRYDKEQSGSVVVNNKVISTDRDTQSKLPAIASSDSITSINWKLKDGTFASLSLEDVILANSEVQSYVQDLFDWEALMVSAINAATTPEELEAVNID